MALNRREFLQGIAVATAASAIPAWPAVSASSDSFEFVFFTDTHIEPELNAAQGCDLCFQKIAALKPDFAVMGGDHVYDALSVDASRATQVFDLYKKTEQVLGMPLHHAIGNHDVFGINAKSGVAPADAGYGKKMYEDRMGRTYYSFNHKGWHFVVLDSIQPTEDRMWEARIDEKQLAWLADDLKGLRPLTPVIGVVHVPLVTAFATYTTEEIRPQKYNTLTVANAPQVLAAFDNHNVVAVLQGHLHVNEQIQYKNTRYITGGAVCGNWWHGPRMGFAEGFTIVSVSHGAISTRYETSGFHSVDPREKF